MAKKSVPKKLKGICTKLLKSSYNSYYGSVFYKDNSLFFIINIIDNKKNMSKRNFPRLNGAFINLRKLSVNDAKPMTNFMSYNIAKNLYDVPYPYTMKNALYFIRFSYSDCSSFKAVHFAIEYRKASANDSLLFVDVISLKDIDQVNKKASLGYWVGEEYWGKGIATKSVQFIISYAFSELGLQDLKISPRLGY